MRILVVEDDIDQALSYAKEFERHGDVCEIARSVSDAMALALRQKWDVAVLDMFLPDGDTASLSNLLRFRSPRTCILSVTGTGVMPHGEHCEITSCDYFLRKPISASEVVTIAHYLVDSRSSGPAPVPRQAS